MSNCPLQCGYDSEIRVIDIGGITFFICPDCLGVAFDGGVLRDPRMPLDLSAVLGPIIERVVGEICIDPLTQIKNRRFFLLRLACELKSASHRHFVSVAAFRIDDENECKAIATVFLTAVRNRDNLARVEADTFGLILPHADEQRAGEIAARIAKSVNSFEFHRTRHAVVTARADEPPEEVWQRLVSELDR